MALNFKDILLFFQDFFQEQCDEIVNKMSTLHIQIRGPDCIQAFLSWKL